MNLAEYIGAAIAGAAGVMVRDKSVVHMPGDQALNIGVLAARILLGDSPMLRPYRQYLHGAANAAVGALAQMAARQFKEQQPIPTAGGPWSAPVVTLAPVSAAPAATLEI